MEAYRLHVVCDVLINCYLYTVPPKLIELITSESIIIGCFAQMIREFMARRDRIVVSTLRCGRSNPGSNPGHGNLL